MRGPVVHTERRTHPLKNRSSAGSPFGSKLFRNGAPAGWPDVSPTPSLVDLSLRWDLPEANSVAAPVTSPASSCRQFRMASLLLLLGDLAGLLRSLLHCALRLLRLLNGLLCLLSFLGHVALLIKVRWLNRCVHSGIEMHFIPNTP